MPMKKEQQKKGGMTTGAAGANTLSVLFLLTITLLLLLNHTTHAIKCRSTGDGGVAKPHDDILSPIEIRTSSKFYSYCFVAYNLDGGEKGHPNWKLKPHTYVAGGGKDFDTNFCSQMTQSGNGSCKVVNTTDAIDEKYWRLDFVCCCDKPYRFIKSKPPIPCNNVLMNDAMNPQIQLEIQLNATDQQIFRVGYPPDKRIDSCTRHTSLNETQSPSKCRSVLQGRQQTLGCAHCRTSGVAERLTVGPK